MTEKRNDRQDKNNMPLISDLGGMIKKQKIVDLKGPLI